MMMIISRVIEELQGDDAEEDSYRMVHAHMVLEGLLPEDTDYDDWIFAADTWLQLADKCAIHQMYSLATDLYGLAITNDTDAYKKPRLWFRFAKACFRCGRVSDAQLAVKQALSRTPYDRQLLHAQFYWSSPRQDFLRITQGDLHKILLYIPPYQGPLHMVQLMQAVVKGSIARRHFHRGVGRRKLLDRDGKKEREIARRLNARIGLLFAHRCSLLLKVDASFIGKITAIRVLDVSSGEERVLSLSVPFIAPLDNGQPSRLRLEIESERLPPIRRKAPPRRRENKALCRKSQDFFSESEENGAEKEKEKKKEIVFTSDAEGVEERETEREGEENEGNEDEDDDEEEVERVLLTLSFHDLDSDSFFRRQVVLAAGVPCSLSQRRLLDSERERDKYPGELRDSVRSSTKDLLAKQTRCKHMRMLDFWRDKEREDEERERDALRREREQGGEREGEGEEDELLGRTLSQALAASSTDSHSVCSHNAHSQHAAHHTPLSLSHTHDLPISLLPRLFLIEDLGEEHYHGNVATNVRSLTLARFGVEFEREQLLVRVRNVGGTTALSLFHLRSGRVLRLVLRRECVDRDLRLEKNTRWLLALCERDERLRACLPWHQGDTVRETEREKEKEILVFAQFARRTLRFEILSLAELSEIERETESESDVDSLTHTEGVVLRVTDPQGRPVLGWNFEVCEAVAREEKESERVRQERDARERERAKWEREREEREREGEQRERESLFAAEADTAARLSLSALLQRVEDKVWAEDEERLRQAAEEIERQRAEDERERERERLRECACFAAEEERERERLGAESVVRERETAALCDEEQRMRVLLSAEERERLAAAERERESADRAARATYYAAKGVLDDAVLALSLRRRDAAQRREAFLSLTESLTNSWFEDVFAESLNESLSLAWDESVRETFTASLPQRVYEEELQDELLDAVEEAYEEEEEEQERERERERERRERVANEVRARVSEQSIDDYFRNAIVRYSEAVVCVESILHAVLDTTDELCDMHAEDKDALCVWEEMRRMLGEGYRSSAVKMHKISSRANGEHVQGLVRTRTHNAHNATSALGKRDPLAPMLNRRVKRQPLLSSSATALQELYSPQGSLSQSLSLANSASLAPYIAPVAPSLVTPSTNVIPFTANNITPSTNVTPYTAHAASHVTPFTAPPLLGSDGGASVHSLSSQSLSQSLSFSQTSSLFAFDDAASLRSALDELSAASQSLVSLERVVDMPSLRKQQPAHRQRERERKILFSSTFNPLEDAPHGAQNTHNAPSQHTQPAQHTTHRALSSTSYTRGRFQVEKPIVESATATSAALAKPQREREKEKERVRAKERERQKRLRQETERERERERDGQESPLDDLSLSLSARAEREKERARNVLQRQDTSVSESLSLFSTEREIAERHDDPESGLYIQSLKQVQLLGYVPTEREGERERERGARRPWAFAAHWERKIGQFLAHHATGPQREREKGKQRDPLDKKRVPPFYELRKMLKTLFQATSSAASGVYSRQAKHRGETHGGVSEKHLRSVEEMLCALAETQGSVGEVLLRLQDSDLEFLSEIQLVCGAINVRAMASAFPGGAELFHRATPSPSTQKTQLKTICERERVKDSERCAAPSVSLSLSLSDDDEPSLSQSLLVSERSQLSDVSIARSVSAKEAPLALTRPPTLPSLRDQAPSNTYLVFPSLSLNTRSSPTIHRNASFVSLQRSPSSASHEELREPLRASLSLSSSRQSLHSLQEESEQHATESDVGRALATVNSASFTLPPLAAIAALRSPTSATQRQSKKRSFRVHQQLVEERFAEAAHEPVAVLCRRDALRATQEELLLKSGKTYLRDPVERKVAVAAKRAQSRGAFSFLLGDSDDGGGDAAESTKIKRERGSSEDDDVEPFSSTVKDGMRDTIKGKDEEAMYL